MTSNRVRLPLVPGRPVGDVSLSASGPIVGRDIRQTMAPDESPGTLKTIYLDYAATTPVDPAVVDAMLPYLTDEFGNAASQHSMGRSAAKAVDEARAEVAGLIGADPEEITFTSGATESINIALKGVVGSSSPDRRHLITVATEHKAVLDTAKALGAAGARTTILPVDAHGAVSLGNLEAELAADTRLISIMAANNETGTLGPIREAAAMARDHGVLFHTDATQFAGKLPVDVDALGVDLLSLSSHKLYGPKGVGTLYVRRDRRDMVAPLIHGGGHERGLRSGTLNVPGIVGFGRACRIANARLAVDAATTRGLREDLEHLLLSALPGTAVNGHPHTRLPHISSLRFDGVDGGSVMLAMPDIAVSAGSACTAASAAPSHVLGAMGLDDAAIGGSIRFSLGRFTTHDDIAYAAARVAVVVELTRRMR